MGSIPDSPLEHPRRLWAASAAWALVIAILTSVPPGAGVPLPGEGPDKALHLLVYAVLAFLLCLAFRASGRPTARAAVLALAIAAAYGIVDEWHQELIPGRNPDLADVLADAVGGVLGAMAGAVVGPREEQRGGETANPADE